MPARSHIDTWMFIKFINLDEDDIDASISSDNLNRRDKTQLLEIYDTQYIRSKALIFHETYHLWQGVRLPFLHRYAILVLKDVIRGYLNQIAVNSNLNSWKLEISYNELYGLHEKMQFEFVGGTILYQSKNVPSMIIFGGSESDINNSYRTKLSIVDLLEASTSIAEYQFICESVSEISDPKKFNIWQKRHPANTSVYTFLKEYFGNDSLVLRLLIPLINASFQTTDPLRTFAELSVRINSAIKNKHPETLAFISQHEPCNWKAFMSFFIDQITFDSKPENWHELKPSQGFHVLDINKLIGKYSFNEESMDLHPVLTPLLRKWLTLEQSYPKDSTTILDYPFFHKSIYEKIWSNFDTLSLIKFNFYNNPPLIISSFANEELNQLIDINYLRFLFAVVGIMRKATGINFEVEHRLCHHTLCPHFKENFCNSFLKIPQNYNDCKFPVDFKIHVDLAKVSSKPQES